MDKYSEVRGLSEDRLFSRKAAIMFLARCAERVCVGDILVGDFGGDAFLRHKYTQVLINIWGLL